MRISRACAERTHVTAKLWVADEPTDAAPPLTVPLGPEMMTLRGHSAAE